MTARVRISVLFAKSGTKTYLVPSTRAARECALNGGEREDKCATGGTCAYGSGGVLYRGRPSEACECSKNGNRQMGKHIIRSRYSCTKRIRSTSCPFDTDVRVLILCTSRVGSVLHLLWRVLAKTLSII